MAPLCSRPVHATELPRRTRSPFTEPIELVLLDRDGTVNASAQPGAYISSPDELLLLDGAAAAIARLNRASIPVVVVTNQRGVARGMMSMGDVDSVHRVLEARLERAGAHLDDILVCPHEEGTCSCRKPNPGMLTTALARVGVEPVRAVMIGDADSDVEAGRRAGTWTIQLVAAGGQTAADVAVSDLAGAVDLLLAPAGQ